MKKSLFSLRSIYLLLLLQIILTATGYTQTCNGLTATVSATESRCTATGSLQINATGGSGKFNFKIQGAANSEFTSSSLISGLRPGVYSAIVKDIISNCTVQIDSVRIAGTYNEPRFGIGETDVSCFNGTDGRIFVTGLTDGRMPFIYTVVAPSAAGIGSSNATGTFTGMIPGAYTIQLADSCGGIQTRIISIQNYGWSITASAVTKISCTNYHAQLTLTDSKGFTNISGTAFTGFTYGFVNGPADTTWFTTSGFNLDLLQKRNLTLVAKDKCGRVQIIGWTNPLIPSVEGNPWLSGDRCDGFDVEITGQQNLTNPNFCLFTSTGSPIPGMPCNTTSVFSNLPYGTYCLKITNTCYDTVITRCFWRFQPVPAVAPVVSLTNYTCTSFQASVTGQQYLTNPQYCLLDNNGNLVSGVLCNTTGIFPNIPFGSYRIRITDGCKGVIITLNFSASPKVRSVAASVTLNNYTCTTFNATITGQTNLSSPVYCLMDGAGIPVAGVPCNNTGVFSNILYGSYCIHITDVCNDTTIKKCFTAVRPDPAGGNPTISNKICTGFTVTIAGQQYIFNGSYCLEDVSGNPVPGFPCNSTGVFINVPYGSYCVKGTDGCSSKTKSWCFTVIAPTPSVGAAVISSITCTGFTATITGQQFLTNPTYCLYNSLNSLVGACNHTGIFAITGFGSYRIVTTDSCHGAVFTTNLSQVKPIPSVSSNVSITNSTCSGFTASITGQANLISPQYILKDNSGVLITSNSTGVFTNLAYGSYCISIVNSCLDTTIVRCFSQALMQTQMTITTTPSCIYNASNISIQVTTGIGPYSATVYNSAGDLVNTTNSASTLFNITGLPALAPGNPYRIVVTAACGLPATQLVTGLPANLAHTYLINARCPSSISPNGSGDLQVHATTNMGAPSLSIIRKNGVATTIAYSSKSGNDFYFSNLDAATYVLAYGFTGCSTIILDTVQLPNYSFPALAPSGAYQCDNNTFSVGASVSGGLAPYTYQIIGSSPSFPNINSAPQKNPVFTISNGVQYALVRLRALDTCGNATLNDVSILPLANTVVKATSECIYKSTTLSSDLVANATWTWYKKSNMSSTDSVLVGTGATYYIPAISVADTGIYVNRMSVNNGCLTRISYFHLDGICNSILLSSPTILSGTTAGDHANRLSWNSSPAGTISRYELEKRDGSLNGFELLEIMNATQPASTYYSYTDLSAYPNENYYRLKIFGEDNQYRYSNVVLLKKAAVNDITVFPNPVKSLLNISFHNNESQRYNLRLFNVSGIQVFETDRLIPRNGELIYHRENNLCTGIYFLQIRGSNHTEVKILKLLFQ